MHFVFIVLRTFSVKRLINSLLKWGICFRYESLLHIACVTYGSDANGASLGGQDVAQNVEVLSTYTSPENNNGDNQETYHLRQFHGS